MGACTRPANSVDSASFRSETVFPEIAIRRRFNAIGPLTEIGRV